MRHRTDKFADFTKHPVRTVLVHVFGNDMSFVSPATTLLCNVARPCSFRGTHRRVPRSFSSHSRTRFTRPVCRYRPSSLSSLRFSLTSLPMSVGDRPPPRPILFRSIHPRCLYSSGSRILIQIDEFSWVVGWSRTEVDVGLCPSVSRNPETKKKISNIIDGQTYVFVT